MNIDVFSPGFTESKRLEDCFDFAVLNPAIVSPHSLAARALLGLFVPNAVESLGKPSTKNSKTYGTGVEPKTDLRFRFDEHDVKVSYKGHEASYMFSTNSPVEYLGILEAACSLHQEHFSKTYSDDIKNELKFLAKYLGRTYKKIDYNRRGLERVIRHLDAWEDPFIREEAKLIVLHDNSQTGKYKNELNKNETSVRETFFSMFARYPDFERCLKWEVLTGCKKFSNGPATANIIVYGKSGKIVKLDDIHGSWFSGIKYVRLQNVPRCEMAGLKKRLTTTAQELANAVRAIDMSLKM